MRSRPGPEDGYEYPGLEEGPLVEPRRPGRPTPGCLREVPSATVGAETSVYGLVPPGLLLLRVRITCTPIETRRPSVLYALSDLYFPHLPYCRVPTREGIGPLWVCDCLDLDFTVVTVLLTLAMEVLSCKRWSGVDLRENFQTLRQV